MRSRLIRTGLLCLALCLVALLAWTPWCLQQAGKAIEGQDLTRASQWLSRAELLPWRTGERSFLQARIARKYGRNKEFARLLESARRAGVEADRLEREVMLQHAQIGDVQPLDEAFPQLLQRGEDLPAICEAYVLGLITQFRIDQALGTLDVWSEDFPSDPQPHFLRGRLYEYMNHLDGVGVELRRALELAPYHAPAAMGLARVESSQQNYELALELYRQAAEHLFEPHPALVGMARCYREQGELEQARAVLQQAMARPPAQLVDAYRYVGDRGETAQSQAPIEMAKLELAENRPEAAVVWFEQALASDRKDWKIRFLLGQTLQRLGKTEEAALHLAQAEAARAAFEEGDLLIDAVRKNPADTEARYRMGLILMEHMSVNNGLVWLKSVLKYDPHHVKTHIKLAEYFATNMAENPDYARLAAYHAEQARRGKE